LAYNHLYLTERAYSKDSNGANPAEVLGSKKAEQIGQIVAQARERLTDPSTSIVGYQTAVGDYWNGEINPIPLEYMDQAKVIGEGALTSKQIMDQVRDGYTDERGTVHPGLTSILPPNFTSSLDYRAVPIKTADGKTIVIDADSAAAARMPLSAQHADWTVVAILKGSGLAAYDKNNSTSAYPLGLVRKGGETYEVSALGGEPVKGYAAGASVIASGLLSVSEYNTLMVTAGGEASSPIAHRDIKADVDVVAKAGMPLDANNYKTTRLDGKAEQPQHRITINVNGAETAITQVDHKAIERVLAVSNPLGGTAKYPIPVYHEGSQEKVFSFYHFDSGEIKKGGADLAGNNPWWRPDWQVGRIVYDNVSNSQTLLYMKQFQGVGHKYEKDATTIPEWDTNDRSMLFYAQHQYKNPETNEVRTLAVMRVNPIGATTNPKEQKFEGLVTMSTPAYQPLHFMQENTAVLSRKILFQHCQTAASCKGKALTAEDTQMCTSNCRKI
jgi:hypothetical protein